MKDMRSSIAVDSALVPAVQTATVTSAAIDLQGYDSATCVIHTGAIVSSGNFTPNLRESTTSGGTYNDVAAEDLIGSFPAALAASTTYRVGYRGNKQFLKVMLTLNSGTSIAAGAMIVKGDPSNGPVA